MTIQDGDHDAAAGAAVARLRRHLPPGFIGDDFAAAWSAQFATGRSGTRAAQRELMVLLPPAVAWPAFEQRCSMLPGETPEDLFARSLDATTSATLRSQRDLATERTMPLRRLSVVQDSSTTDLHRGFHGFIAPRSDAFWSSWDAGFAWGCRCTTSVMNERTADRRGWTVSR